MTFSYNETLSLIRAVLNADSRDCRKQLHEEMRKTGRHEAEFYAGVIEHGPGMSFLTSEQWFDFHSKIPLEIFRREVALMNKLSENQREALPAAI